MKYIFILLLCASCVTVNKYYVMVPNEPDPGIEWSIPNDIDPGFYKPIKWNFDLGPDTVYYIESIGSDTVLLPFDFDLIPDGSILLPETGELINPD